MVEAIRRIVRRLFPELTGRYHLPMFARIVAIADNPDKPQLCDSFRPYLAADIEILDEQGRANKSFPVYPGIPLPVPMGGTEERGSFAFASVGTVVEVAFAYGSPHRPFIRSVLPHGAGVPELHPDDLVIQQSDAVSQRATDRGDWIRKTTGDISDESLRRFVEALYNQEQYLESLLKVDGNSTEEVSGVKLIEALGALKLLSGGTLNLAAADNLNQTTGSDINTTVGRDLKESVGNVRESLAKLRQRMKVKDGGKVWVGSESVNIAQVLLDLIGVVEDFAGTCATHTHPSVGVTTQSGTFSGYESTAGNLKGQLSPVVE